MSFQKQTTPCVSVRMSVYGGYVHFYACEREGPEVDITCFPRSLSYIVKMFIFNMCVHGIYTFVCEGAHMS